nr:disks large homolog 5-like isoform X2 [Peromyscus maniculatus bairdii]
MEHTQLKDQVAMLRQENKNRIEDWVLLKHHLEALKLICEDQEEQTSDPQTQQQQEFERLEGSLQVLRKQKEMITQEKDLAEKLQHHFEVSQMRPWLYLAINPGWLLLGLDSISLLTILFEKLRKPKEGRHLETWHHSP